MGAVDLAQAFPHAVRGGGLVASMVIPNGASGDGMRAVIASITLEEGRARTSAQSMFRPWQSTAWAYWALLPELMYPTTQLARLCTRMNWHVTISGVPLESDPPEGGGQSEVDVFLAKVTDGIGLTEAIRLLALNLQVPAECWYVQQGDASADADVSRNGDAPTQPTGKGWTVVSIVDPNLTDIRDNPSYRKIHVRITDPRDQRYAISSFATLIGPAEELSTLAALSRAQTRSRLSQAGILLRPKEVRFPTTDSEGRPISTFGERLQAAMTAPIADEYAPSAVVPIDLEVPGETIEQWRHLTFDREYDDTLHDKIERVTRRIALGLDIPPELLLGTADLNHWSAWLVDEDTYRSHAEPLASAIGEVFAFAGEQLLDLPEGEIEVTPDPSELLARRSTVRDAFTGLRMGVVNFAYARKAMGATEDDAPDDAELQLIMAINGSAVTDTDVAIAEDVGDAEPTTAGGGDREPPPLEDSPGMTRRPAAATSTLTAALDPATATEHDYDTFGNNLADLDIVLRESLIAAMDMAVATARSRVGAKVRTAMRTDDDATEQLRPIDNGDVVATLGPRAFEAVDVAAVVRDTYDGDLSRWWAQRLARAAEQLASLAVIDTTDAAWAEPAAASQAALVSMLTDWTVAELTRTTAAMNAIPAGLAREVVAIAGGSS